MKKKESSSNTNEDDLQTFFKYRREHWKDIVSKILLKLKKIETLAETEIIIRNEIMNIIDEKAALINKLISLNKVLRKNKENIFYEIRTEIDVKIKNNNDQLILIESKNADTLEKQELLEMQIDFLDKTYFNLKDMTWSIKNHIELYKQEII